MNRQYFERMRCAPAGQCLAWCLRVPSDLPRVSSVSVATYEVSNSDSLSGGGTTLIIVVRRLTVPVSRRTKRTACQLRAVQPSRIRIPSFRRSSIMPSSNDRPDARRVCFSVTSSTNKPKNKTTPSPPACLVQSRIRNMFFEP